MIYTLFDYFGGIGAIVLALLACMANSHAKDHDTKLQVFHHAPYDERHRWRQEMRGAEFIAYLLWTVAIVVAVLNEVLAHWG